MRKLIGIGTGPGPTDLLTVRAVEAIKNADHIFAPDNRGKSMALDTARPYVDENKVTLLAFPMGESTEETYDLAFAKILDTIKENEVGVFLNIGDSTIYSTFLNMVEGRSNGEISIELIPGIPSFVAAANVLQQNLVKKDENFTLMDRIDKLESLDSDNLAILKTKDLEETLDILDNNSYSYKYIENIGYDNQLILQEKREILDRKKYMSLILARRK